MVGAFPILSRLYLDNKVKVNKSLAFSSFGYSKKWKKNNEKKKKAEEFKYKWTTTNKNLLFSRKNKNNQRNCFKKQKPIYLACKKIRNDCCGKQIGVGGDIKNTNLRILKNDHKEVLQKNPLDEGPIPKKY